MNELPKSVRDELARQQAAGLAHPDADLLTAFAEGTATPTERATVEQHLARCRECREVLFLATPAQEASSTVTALKPQRRTRWFPVWAPWAAAAMILFAATWTVTEHKTKSEIASRSDHDKISTYTTAQTQAAPKTEPVAPAPETTKPSRAVAEAATGDAGAGHAASPAIAAERKSAQEQSKDELDIVAARRDKEVLEAKKDSAQSGTLGGLAADSAAQNSTMARTEAAPAAAPPPPPASSPADRLATASRNTSLKPGPSAPVQSQMAQNQSTQSVAIQAEENSPSAAGAKAAPMKTMARAAAAPQSHWRISAAGGLERQAGNSGWTPVTLAPGTHFTVVATVGNTVWAGNDVGGLYRSEDGGANWASVSLPSLAKGPGARIAAIEFRDSLSGAVTTADGGRWSTSDGGRSWQQD